MSTPHALHCSCVLKPMRISASSTELSAPIPPFMQSNFNTLWASLAIDTLIANGIDHFFISPGSRSTPLTLAASKHPRAHCFVIHDERSAAFQALGYGRWQNKAAALICTSGTAVANYYPAVIEAAQDMIPLIVLSGDRPPELRDCGANQTIQQQHIFGAYVREFVEMPTPQARLAPRFVVSRLEQALFRAQAPVKGPVHINFPFAEPLTPAPAQAEAEAYAAAIAQLTLPQTQYTLAAETPAFALDLKTLQQHKGLLLIGRLPPAMDKAPLLALANALQWPTFADPLSNMRPLLARTPQGISAYDLLLRQQPFKDALQNFAPDLILHLGQGFVSKALLQYLDAYLATPSHCQYIQITQNPRPQDPNYRVSQHRVQAPDAFARQLLQGSKPLKAQNQAETKPLQHIQHQARQHIKHWSQNTEVNELSVAAWCLEALDMPLFVGNSMAIRDVDSVLDEKSPILVGSRGTSGIDGNLAMLGGVIIGSGKPAALLCGDLTLYHDLNSLGTFRQLPAGAIVVVVNNQGGGIFSFLPVAHAQGGVGDPERVEQYFGTPHPWHFEHAAALFQLHYAQPKDRQDFQTALTQAQQHAAQGQSTLIEIKTDRALNYQQHQVFYQLPLT